MTTSLSIVPPPQPPRGPRLPAASIVITIRGHTLMTTPTFPPFPHYYDATEHFAKRFDKVGRELGVHRQDARGGAGLAKETAHQTA